MTTKFDVGDHVGGEAQVVSIGTVGSENVIEYGLRIKTSAGTWIFHANESELFELPKLDFPNEVNE